MLLKCLPPHITSLTSNPNFSPFFDSALAPRPHLHHLECRRRRSPRVLVSNGDGNQSFESLYSAEEERREEGGEEERGSEEREVKCEVEVVSWRERRIRAEIEVNADVESVWNVLTDYERLADFIPNLVCSGRIQCPHPGRIWLEQRGLQRALYWHIEARVVLDLKEFPTSPDDRELHFFLVDGDFKKFEGKWSIKSDKRSLLTTLSYEVNVIPQFNFPTIFLEKIILSDLPVNLRALAHRAESNLEGVEKLPATRTSKTEALLDVGADGMKFLLKDDSKLALGERKKSLSSSGSGLVPQTAHLSSAWGVFGKTCNIDNPCMIDEIHLRRYDGLLESGGVHRSVAATITVKAPVSEVWNCLTAYEEGCKGLLYMVLHARVVMDLCEHREQEIAFEQVEGDFDSFQGRWQFEQLGNHHTLLKYYVESKVRKDTLLSEAIMEEVIYEDLPSNLCAIRDYIEKRIDTSFFQLLDNNQPSTSSSEKNSFIHEKRAGPGSGRRLSRHRVPGLQHDFGVLQSEIEMFVSEHGQEGFMPMRKQLRMEGRIDIEKAIGKMGGFRKIASLMNLSLAYKNRKPKGYWENLENLRDEIKRFQANWGMDPSFMPSRKTFERAGRYDIARALEKWGGLHEVAQLLSLKLRQSGRQGKPDKDMTAKRTSTSVAGRDVNDASGHHASENTSTWLTNLDDFDIDLG
ncbi:hypothetical protein Drorol1_Dr00001797 [Drosera rotundifolia]